MMTSEKTSGSAGILTLFGTSLVALELAGTALAAIGLFSKPAVLAVFLLTAAASAIMLMRRRSKAKPSAIILTVAFAAISALIAWNPEPTIFSGRDQGSFSEAAIRLAENHRLEFSTEASREFFRIYGPGEALNFPGFSYTAQGDLVTHFSIGYISWLAMFYSLFGLAGLSIANAAAFFLFILSFHALLRVFLKPWPALVGTAFVLASFVFSWLAKMTLGENLALGLLWFAVFQAVRFFKEGSRRSLFFAFSSLLVLALTRLESWAFILALLIGLAIKSGSLSETAKTLKSKGFFAFMAIFAVILAISIKANSAFYVSSAKGLLGSFSGQGNGGDFLAQTDFLWKVLNLYAASQFIILGAVGAALLLSRRDYVSLVPALIILPSAIYLFHPGISQDHPWMLRRFAFSVIPAGMLYATLLLDRLLMKRWHFNGIAFLMIASELLASFALFQPSETSALLAETGKLSQAFSDRDLVLIDRETTGSGWNMLSGPLSFLYGKQSAYFFNPNDYAKLDRSRFENVFLMVPDSNIAFYESFPDFPDLSETPSDSYSLKTVARIDPGNENEPELPVFQETTITGKIYKLND